MSVRRDLIPKLLMVLAILFTAATAQAQSVVGGWVGQGVEPFTGLPTQVQYSFFPTGEFQKSFAMPGGYDYVAGTWFTQGEILRLDVREHYSTAGEGPLPPGESWYFEMPNANTLVLVNAACPSPQMIDLCRLVLQRAQ